MTNLNYSYYQTQTKKPTFNSEKTPLTPQIYTYHHTYYFDWLKQKESVVAECAINNNSYLLLTNKALRIKTTHKSWGESTKIMPLGKVSGIEANFQRLLFPLIIGGIVAPLALVAALAGAIHFWIGMAMTISGLSLIYYGWLGAYQLKIILFQNQQHAYFVDLKTKKIENFIEETRKLLALKEQQSQ
ncbi:MAG: hypothetical protein EAZ08_10345 [Cytophagales bacterium]|nr:MAG: hypothetical protein EAZ08_10345 [Cytophagales bacterium]